LTYFGEIKFMFVSKKLEFRLIKTASVRN